jgi:hypothetical protein
MFVPFSQSDARGGDVGKGGSKEMHIHSNRLANSKKNNILFLQILIQL